MQIIATEIKNHDCLESDIIPFADNYFNLHAEKYNTCPVTIRNILLKNKIHIRTRSEGLALVRDQISKSLKGKPVPCPTRIHKMFNGRAKDHIQNVNAMLGLKINTED